MTTPSTPSESKIYVTVTFVGVFLLSLFILLDVWELVIVCCFQSSYLIFSDYTFNEYT